MASRRSPIKAIVRALAVGSVMFVTVAGQAVLPAQATPSTVVVPNADTSAEGNVNNVIPFDCAQSSLTSMRYQQIYLGSQVGAGTISQMAFRDGVFPSTTIPNITIRLSTTSKAVTGLDTLFANNVGPDVSTVFSGDLTISGTFPGTAPGPFNILIPFQTAFAFNPAGGNLLVDVTIPTCERTSDFDADFQIAGSAVMARMYESSSTSTTGHGDGSIFGGLVTQFTLGGTTAPVCHDKNGQVVPCPKPGGPPGKP